MIHPFVCSPHKWPPDPPAELSAWRAAASEAPAPRQLQSDPMEFNVKLPEPRNREVGTHISNNDGFWSICLNSYSQWLFLSQLTTWGPYIVAWNLFRSIYLDHPCTAKHRPWEQPIRGGKYSWQGLCYPLVMTNIAIEHGPFIVDLPIKDGDFP